MSVYIGFDEKKKYSENRNFSIYLFTKSYSYGRFVTINLVLSVWTTKGYRLASQNKTSFFSNVNSQSRFYRMCKLKRMCRGLL